MTPLIIVAHAPLAGALLAVGRHAFPDCAARLQALDVAPGDDPAAIETRLRALVGSASEALILCDVFGATPCNVAQRVADGARVRVVTGVNAPMVWRSLCYAHEPVDALVARAVAGGAQGVMQLAATRPQNQSPKVRHHDPLQPHDQ